MKIRYLGEEDRFSRLLHAIKDNTPVYSGEWYKKIAPAKVPLTNISLEYGTNVLEYLETIAYSSINTDHTLDQTTKELLGTDCEKMNLLDSVFIMSQKAKPEEAERYDTIVAKLFEKGAVPSAGILTHIENDKFRFLKIWLTETYADQRLKDFGARAILALLLSDRIDDDTKRETIKGIVEKGLKVGSIGNLQDRDHKIFNTIMKLYGNTEANDPVWTTPLRAVMCSVMQWNIKEFEARFAELKDSLEVQQAYEEIMNSSKKLVIEAERHLRLEAQAARDHNTLEAAKNKMNSIQSTTPKNPDLLAQSFIQGHNDEQRRTACDFEMRKKTFENTAKVINDHAEEMQKDFANTFSDAKARYSAIVAKRCNIEPQTTSYYSTTISAVKLDISSRDSIKDYAIKHWPMLDNYNKKVMMDEYIRNGNAHAVAWILKLGIDFSQNPSSTFELFAGQNKGQTALANPQLALTLYVLDVPPRVEIQKQGLSPVIQRAVQCLEGKLEKIPMSI